MSEKTNHHDYHRDDNRQNPVQVEMDGPIWLKLRMEVPAGPPEDLLRWFTDPARLAQWMGDAHEVDLVPGGRYAIRWESARAWMEGTVIVVRPTEFVFSWAFLHEPEKPARVVMVRAACSSRDSTCSITIIHGPYRDDLSFAPAARTEAQDRADHREGWSTFLPILHARLRDQAPPA